MRDYDTEAAMKLYRLAERLDDLNMPWLAMELRGNLHKLLPRNFDDTGRGLQEIK